MQDLEFTVEDNRLYILQTRNGKRTGHAAVRIAVDMVGEKLISKEEAMRSVPADSLSHLLAPVFDQQSCAGGKERSASGLAAGPGAAVDMSCSARKEAVDCAAAGQQVILVRIETSPEDLRGMIAAEESSRRGEAFLLTLRSLRARWGRSAFVALLRLRIDYTNRTVRRGDVSLKRGDFISVDGTAGEVLRRRSQDGTFRDCPGAGRIESSIRGKAKRSRVRVVAELGRQGSKAGYPH